jgi:hypothetical protein
VHVLGLQVTSLRSRRIVRGVILDTDTDSMAANVEHIPDPRHNEAMQTREARDAIATALRAHNIAAAVLLEADYHPQAGKSAGSKNRMRLEGACLSACRDHTPTVEVMNGPALGRACGGKKEDALAAARRVGVPDDLVEAAAAALAAKSLQISAPG